MNNNAIFISAGRNEDLATNVIRNNRHNFDIYVNIYENFLNQKFVENNATKCFYYKTTKFIALKEIYASDLKDYKSVAVFDDDGVFTHGSVNDLPDYLEKYNLDIIAPCQHPYGKLSGFIGEIMKFHKGDHLYRSTNFVEMNFPVFSQEALQKYMNIYDGNLCGYGNDWWYLNILDANNKKCCGITDKVVIYNPQHWQKKYPMTDNRTDIDVYMDVKNRKLQWQKIKDKYGLLEWDISHEFIST